ncbi:3,4-dihydroxyphenylacetate 2,3-dioxygenase, partial [Corynebacterium propinquum]
QEYAQLADLITPAVGSSGTGHINAIFPL